MSSSIGTSTLFFESRYETTALLFITFSIHTGEPLYSTSITPSDSTIRLALSLSNRKPPRFLISIYKSILFIQRNVFIQLSNQKSKVAIVCPFRRQKYVAILFLR